MMAASEARGLAERSGLLLRDLAIAALLGGPALALNFLEVQLGWGLHFIFGNALIFAFLRTVSPRRIVLAAAIASFRSVMLWGHPWAWLIWTAEAAVLAYSVRRTAPVRASVLFWVFLGTPLLALTYGWIMGMDRTSLLLVIGKQAVNGVLNVALGEALYLGFLILAVRRRRLRWPTVSIEATFQMFTMLTILVPTVIYLSIDAPNREAAARETVATRLEDRIFVAGAQLDSWRQAREADIEALVHEHGQPEGPDPQTLDHLYRDFDALAVVADGGDVRTFTRPAQREATGLLLAGKTARPSQPGVRLLVQPDRSGQTRLVMVVRTERTSDRWAVAALRTDALKRILGRSEQPSDLDLYLVGPDHRPYRVASKGEAALPLDRPINAEALRAADRAASVIGPRTYGDSLMSDLRKALLMRAMPAPGLLDWQILVAAPLEPGVLQARKGQSVMFLTLFGLVIAMMLLSAGLARRLELSLRRIARAAADVTLTGARPERVDSLVISELNDITVNLATTDTEVSRERSALIDYQRRLLSISTHAPVVVYAVGRSGSAAGRLLYISDSVEKLLGYRTVEARTVGWLLRKIHPDDRPRYEAALADLQETDAFELEYRIRHRKGHWVWIYDTIALASDPYFKRSETVGLMIDVTDRKAAAEQLVQADKMAGLGQMVAGIAHELNQPLNFIQIAVSNLKERTARNMLDRDRFAQKFDQVLSHVDRAAAIIQQMRVFGRTSSEPPQPVRLTEVVDAVLTMVRPQLSNNGIAIDADGVDSSLLVQAGPNLLEQVLLNLFLNSEHAIRSRAEQEPEHQGRITLATRTERNQIVLTFDDNGTGFSPEAAKKLFEPFFTTKPPREGMGLGLSISYEIIRDLGGDITAANNGDGARFVIRLKPA